MIGRYSQIDREPVDSEPLGVWGWAYAVLNVIVIVLWLALIAGWIQEFIK